MPAGASPALAAAQVVSLAPSAYGHNLLVRANGSLWAWGANSYGELGDGTTTGRPPGVYVLRDGRQSARLVD